MLRSTSIRGAAASSAQPVIPTYKGLKIVRSATAPIVTITLDRPRQKNAITYDMYRGLTDCFNNFSLDPSVGAIVLTGEGDYYCSGNDLKNFFQFGMPRTLAHTARVVCGEFVTAFIDCEKPIVIGVNGPAIGIAVTTMQLCDFRYCTPNATFHTPFKALAQGPEGCSSYMFPKVLGKELATQMLIDGYTMGADEALKHKFVHEIVPRDAILAKCERVAADIATGKTFVERYTRKERTLLQEVSRMELEFLEEAWVSRECFEALEKFMAKKGQKSAAFAFKALNNTRFLWDRR